MRAEACDHSPFPDIEIRQLPAPRVPTPPSRKPRATRSRARSRPRIRGT